MRILPLQATYPNFNYITSPDSFFGNVKEEFREYRESGFFNKSPNKSIYIYQIQTERRFYTGIIACLNINDYFEGKLKKHENTLAPKEQQQMHLLLHRNAMVKPVLSTFPDTPGITKILNDYSANTNHFFSASFEKGNEKHIFWEISDPSQIESIQQIFRSEVPASYIADGHHRTSVTALLHQRKNVIPEKQPFDRLLCAFFPVSQLEVFDYNRIVRGLDEITPASFMAQLSRLFKIKPLKSGRKPTHKHEIILYVQHGWYRLKWKKSILRKFNQSGPLLDASMLDSLVLNKILGIEDVRNDERLSYVEGVSGLADFKSKVIRHEHNVGFLLYPVFTDDIIAISDRQEVMPPKSTWFEPRMKNGLIVYEW